LSDEKLSTLDYETIKEQLTKPYNKAVQPGSSIPFQVVFSDFPMDLEEFTVEVIDSEP